MTSGKNPVVAVLLSFFIAGLGQFYVGDNGKGIMFIIIGLVLAGIGSTGFGLIISLPLYSIIWLWSMIAAANACKANV